jgi:5-methyltetrahydrofolate--homocysteine methyltransferase
MLQVEIVHWTQVVPGQMHRELDLLKVGEELFFRASDLLKKHGAAVVVMAFDEEGQAATADERSVFASARTTFGEQGQVPSGRYYFDPNVLTMELVWKSMLITPLTLSRRADDRGCPYVKISGGISNLSFVSVV